MHLLSALRPAGLGAAAIMLAFSAFTPARAHSDPSLQTSLEPLLAGPWRSDANKARDQYRHPVQTLHFFGLKPAMTVIEINPGGASAWYAELLAPFLAEQGQYIAANIDPAATDPRAASFYQRTIAAQKTKFAAAPAQYGKARVVTFDLKAPVFGPPASADMVLTFRNVHNWVKGDEVPGMFKAAFTVLKPGGVFGVVDHRSAPGKSLKEVVDSGYLPTDFVIEQAQAAGFALDQQSEVNANPKDTRDHVKGVWTLPPVLANAQLDRAKYLAIGESDRFTLRFVKPAK